MYICILVNSTSNPLVSQEAMRERMEGRRMVRLSTIKLHLRGGEIEGDWATIAVLVAKGNPKDSQKVGADARCHRICHSQMSDHCSRK